MAVSISYPRPLDAKSLGNSLVDAKSLRKSIMKFSEFFNLKREFSLTLAMVSAKPAEAHGVVVELATKVAGELGIKTITAEEKSGGTMFGSNIKFVDIGGGKTSKEKNIVCIKVYYTGAKGARIEVTVEPQSLVLRTAVCMFLRKTFDMEVELPRLVDELEASLQVAISKLEGGDEGDQDDSDVGGSSVTSKKSLLNSDCDSDEEEFPVATPTPAPSTRVDKAGPTTRFRGNKHVNVHSGHFGARMQSGLHGGELSTVRQRSPGEETAEKKKMRHKSPELEAPSKVKSVVGSDTEGLLAPVDLRSQLSDASSNSANTTPSNSKPSWASLLDLTPLTTGDGASLLKGGTPTAMVGLESGASFWAAFASQVAKELKSSNAALNNDKDNVPNHLVLFGRGRAVNNGMTHTLQEIIFGIDKIYAVIPGGEVEKERFIIAIVQKWLLSPFDRAAWESVPMIQSAELMRGQGKYPFGVHVSFSKVEECKMVMQAVNASTEGRSVRNPDSYPLADVFYRKRECHDTCDNDHNNSFVCTLGINSNKLQSKFDCTDRIANTGVSKKRYLIKKFNKKRNVIRLATQQTSLQQITPSRYGNEHKVHLKSGDSFIPPRKSKHTIRLGSYNVHLTRPEVRLEVLRETIFHSAIDILAIQESWLTQKDTCNSVFDALESLNIKNRYVFINNRSGEKGGGQILIVHRKLGPVSRFAINSFIDKSQMRYLEDTQWILIKHLNLIVGNIYLRPTKRQGGGFKSQLKALQSVVSGVAQSANYNIILVGDFNFQVSATKTNLFDDDLKYIDHESSGQVSGGRVRMIPKPHGNTTSKADGFVRNLESVPLVLLTGLLGEADYTFCAARGNDSLLDYCFCSPMLVSEVDSYVTWPHYVIPFSDHKLITVDVKMQKANSTNQQCGGNYIPQKTKYVWRRNADLNVCVASLPALPCDLHTASSEDILQFFYSKYCPIIDVVARNRRQIHDQKHANFFVHPVLKELRKKKLELLRQLAHIKDKSERKKIIVDLKEFNVLFKKKLRELRKERKDEDLRQVVVQMKANPRKAWAILRRFLDKESDSPRQIENDGGEVVVGKDAATVFAEQYYKQLNRPSNLPAPPTYKLESVNDASVWLLVLSLWIILRASSNLLIKASDIKALLNEFETGLPPGVTVETETLPSSNHGTSRHGFTYTVGSLRQVHQLEDSKRDLEGTSIEIETLTSSKHGTDRLDSTYSAGPLASRSLRSAQEDYYKLKLKNEAAKAHWRTYLFHPKFLAELLASVILLTAAVVSGYAASSAKNDVSALNALLDQAKTNIVLYQAEIQSLVSMYETTVYDNQLAWNRSLADTQSAYKAELADVKLQYDKIKLEYAAFISYSQLAWNRSLADTQSAYKAELADVKLQYDKIKLEYAAFISYSQLAWNRSLVDTQSVYKAELADVKLQYDEIKIEYAAFVSNSQLAWNRSLVDTQSVYKAELADVKLQYDEIKIEYAALVSNSQLAFNSSLADAQSAYKAELAEIKLQYAALVSAFASSIYDAQLGFNDTLKLKQDVNSTIILTLDHVSRVEHEILSFNQSYPYPWEIEAETKTHAQALNTVVEKLYGCELECRQVGCCYTTVQLVPTKGAKSWEAFRIGNSTYLLVANDYDGSTYLVNSTLYRFDEGKPASPLVQVQTIPTKGAWDWEAFQIGNLTYLLVANSFDGLTYLVNSTLYRFDQGKPASPLVQVQTIPTKGAVDWEAFQIGDVTYLIVANNFAVSTWLVNSTLYRFNEGQPASPLVQVQTIPTNGAIDWEAFQIGNATYLLVANTYNGSTWLVNSTLYRFDQRQPASPLVQVQTIPTKGANDWEVFQIGSVTYLLVASYYDGSTHLLNSVLYRFDQGQSASPLVQVQTIPTKGAKDWEVFQIGSVTYLLVASYYDGSTHLLNSVLYRFDQGQSASPLVQVQNIQTKGAFDWEVFQMGSVTYLIVANGGDAISFRGCFANEGSNRVGGHYLDENWAKCAGRSTFFGMEFPQGYSTFGNAECVPLPGGLPALVKVADVECAVETDDQGRRLGGFYRLAVYGPAASASVSSNEGSNNLVNSVIFSSDLPFL
eukprot:g67015.t1